MAVFVSFSLALFCVYWKLYYRNEYAVHTYLPSETLVQLAYLPYASNQYNSFVNCMILSQWTGQLNRCRDWLRAARSGDRIMVGARFSAFQTGPGDHPASCTMGTGSFPGVESGRGVTLTPHPLPMPRSKNGVELYLYSPLGTSWSIQRVKATLTIISTCTIQGVGRGFLPHLI